MPGICFETKPTFKDVYCSCFEQLHPAAGAAPAAAAAALFEVFASPNVAMRLLYDTTTPQDSYFEIYLPNNASSPTMRNVMIDHLPLLAHVVL